MANRRDITTSPRVQELRRVQRKRRSLLFIVFIILFIVLVIGLSYLSHQPKVTISNINIEGTHIIDSMDVQQTVMDHLSGNFFYIFSKKNTFLYPKSKIEKDLQKKFTRINKLSVKLEGLNTLKVVIDERVGSYMYCGDNIPENQNELGENCYFVNSDGYIFDVAPYFSGNIYFKFYIPLSNDQDILSQQILDKKTFREVISFVDGLVDLGLDPVSVVMYDKDRYSFNLRSNTINVHPEILFKEDNELPVIFGNLSAAMQNSDFKNEIFSRFSTLSYIDLRFDNKVLYKFQ